MYFAAVYSSGRDAVVKHFDPRTGQVASRLQLPEDDSPTVMHALSPQALLLGTEAGYLYHFDIREGGSIVTKPARKTKAHRDNITSICPMPTTAGSTSGFPRQWVTTGNLNLALTDLRKGVIATSEDQDDELQCSAVMPAGLGPKKLRDNPVVVVGTSEGVLTLWDKGSWDDQQDRIRVTAGPSELSIESLDTIVRAPTELGWGAKVVVGTEHGKLCIVDVGKRQVHSTLSHDDAEGVIGVGFDSEGRLISAGGTTVKIWQENDDICDESDEDEDEDGEESSNKRDLDSDGDSDVSGEDSDGSDEPRVKKKRPKKKRKGASGISLELPDLD
jgi:WD repeat-containing protein 55